MKVQRDAPAEYAALGPLPMRVRAKSGEVVGSGTTGVPVEVPDGSYLLTVLLPDGREIGLEDSPPDEPAAMMADAAPAQSAADLVTACKPAASKHLEMPAGIWQGDLQRCWTSGAPALTDISSQLTLSSQAPIFIRAHAEGDQLVVLRLEDRLRCTVVPYDECGICGASEEDGRGIAACLVMRTDGPMVAFRSTVSEEANTLLSFVELGVLTNMVAVTEDEVRHSEQALQAPRSSVLRAITGAYVLLRSNALQGLDQWLGQLEPLAGKLPDLLPLRAELAAREGRHEEAVPLIDAWIRDGRCPWFRSGLSYMNERIKLYLDVTDNDKASFNLGPDEYRRFQAAGSRLERMLTAMLTSRYIATFDLPLPE